MYFKLQLFLLVVQYSQVWQNCHDFRVLIAVLITVLVSRCSVTEPLVSFPEQFVSSLNVVFYAAKTIAFKEQMKLNFVT